jgi:hypothetical protein
MTIDAEWETIWHERLRALLAGMKYGTVQIVVHDGRIVQIERTEKFRFDGANNAGKLPGT